MESNIFDVFLKITHGFDNTGHKFDADGVMSDWWDEQTKEDFKKRFECMIQQYDNYTDPITGMNLNGEQTLGENIADNGGLKLSYRAFRKFIDKTGEKIRLPGLSYTSEQLFWIMNAQVWCTVYRKPIARLQIQNGLHTLAQFRVNGPASNLKEFSNDFQCPVGSPMNPVEKCKVW